MLLSKHLLNKSKHIISFLEFTIHFDFLRVILQFNSLTLVSDMPKVSTNLLCHCIMLKMTSGQGQLLFVHVEG